MNRSNLILSGLLAISLAWAFGVTREPAEPSSDRLVPVWSIEPGQVRRIEYQSGTTRVSLDVRGSDYPPLWLETETTGPVPPLPGKAASDAKKTIMATVRSAFKVHPQTERVVIGISELKAVRDLGAADKLKLADFGLAPENTPGALRIESKDGQTSLKLSLGANGPGQATRYVLSARDNHVYLVRQAAFSNLASPLSLMDRELLPVPVTEADQIEIRMGGQTLTLHRLGDKKAPPPPAPKLQRVGEPPAPTAPVNWGRVESAKDGEPSLLAVANAVAAIKVVRYDAGASKLDPAQASLTVVLRKAPALDVTLNLYEGKGAEASAVSSYTVRPVVVQGAAVKALKDVAKTALGRGK